VLDATMIGILVELYPTFTILHVDGPFCHIRYGCLWLYRWTSQFVLPTVSKTREIIMELCRCFWSVASL